jgi:hypothetical protein
MTRQIRVLASVIALTLAGVATLATEPSSATTIGANVERSLSLTDSEPTLVEHVTTTMTGGNHPETVEAILYIDWTQPGPKPVEISIVRDSDASAVDLGPDDSQGRLGASFAPFAACSAAGPCEASFTVTLRRLSSEPINSIWGFGLVQHVDQAAASNGAKFTVVVSP